MYAIVSAGGLDAAPGDDDPFVHCFGAGSVMMQLDEVWHPPVGGNWEPDPDDDPVGWWWTLDDGTKIAVRHDDDPDEIAARVHQTGRQIINTEEPPGWLPEMFPGYPDLSPQGYLSIPLLAAVCLGTSGGSWTMHDHTYWRCTPDDLTVDGATLVTILESMYRRPVSLVTVTDT